jgi:hypothetical protein
MATAFQEHPYHHPIIGWLDDVENVPLERMHEFYNTFYWPNNATLMVVGDFDTSDCLQIIAETYGQIPAATHAIPQVYTKEPPQQGERRFKIVKPSTSPAEVVIGFHVPEAIHSDSYALAALATVLGDSGKRNSRLYKALVEKRLAVQCYAAPSGMKDPGLFILGGTCAPGVSPDQVEAALLAEVDKVRKELVGADELERAKMANRRALLWVRTIRWPCSISSATPKWWAAGRSTSSSTTSTTRSPRPTSPLWWVATSPRKTAPSVSSCLRPSATWSTTVTPLALKWSTARLPTAPTPRRAPTPSLLACTMRWLPTA